MNSVNALNTVDYGRRLKGFMRPVPVWQKELIMTIRFCGIFDKPYIAVFISMNRHDFKKIQKMWFVIIIFNRVCFGEAVLCPAVSEMVGYYKTDAIAGYNPNVVNIKKVNQENDYMVSVASYWPPIPFDNGTRGAVGYFSEKLIIPEPWTCIAYCIIDDIAKDDSSGWTCVLVFRFVGNTAVYVEGLGQCGHFHGHLAYPDGKYIRE